MHLEFVPHFRNFAKLKCFASGAINVSFFTYDKSLLENINLKREQIT